MCRNIRTLFNFDPPATDDEVRAASVQFVRKLSGFTKPSQANAAAFDQAVDDVAVVARRLIDSLVTVVDAARSRGMGRPRQGARRRTLREVSGSGFAAEGFELAVEQPRDQLRHACPARAGRHDIRHLFHGR